MLSMHRKSYKHFHCIFKLVGHILKEFIVNIYINIIENNDLVILYTSTCLKSCVKIFEVSWQLFYVFFCYPEARITEGSPDLQKEVDTEEKSGYRRKSWKILL